MAWPQTAIVTDEPVTTYALNSLPVMIANTTLGSDTASIGFSSIPNHYAHLLVVSYLRGTSAVGYSAASVRLNGDSGANYDYQTLTGNLAGVNTVNAGEAFAQTSATLGDYVDDGVAANLFSPLTFMIPNYANATSHKVVTTKNAAKRGVVAGNQDIITVRVSGYWNSTDAINAITILPQANNFKTGSRATLYGLP